MSKTSFATYLTKEKLVGVALICATILAATAIFGLSVTHSTSLIAGRGNTVSVTGSTERLVTSDAATIQITLRGQGKDAKTAITTVRKDETTLKSLLSRADIPEDAISMSQPQVTEQCALDKNQYPNCSLGVIGYESVMSLTISTSDISVPDTLTQALESSDAFTARPTTYTQYLYTNLKNIRVAMMSEATANAKERALAIAQSTGSSIDGIEAATAGVFQVTSPDSTDVSDYGTYDTSTKDKKITATVRVDFKVK